MMLYNKRNLLFVFSAMLSLLLVACGGGEGDSANVNLSQTLTYEDGMGSNVTVSYPEGWSATDADGSASFASSEELLAQASGADVPDVGSGEVVAVMLALPPDMVSFFVSEGEEVSAVGLANSFVADLIDEDSTVGDTEETTIDGKEAAVVQGTADGVDVVLVTIALDDNNYALVFGATAEGEGDDIRATIEAMAGSVEYGSAE